MKIAALSLLALTFLRARAQAADKAGAFDGEWRTSFGVVTVKHTGNDVTATYGDAGQFSLKGKVQGKKLTFEYQEGQSAGEGHWTLDDSGHAFRGGFKIRGGRQGEWLGWKPDPKALESKTPIVAGLWLTDLGLMELEQDEGNVNGRYAIRGVSEIKGNLTGRRLDFTYKSFRSGKGWLDVSPDAAAKTFAGAANTHGFPGWYGVRGRRAPEFVRHVKLAPGKIVDGSTKGLLTYCVRAPEAFKPGDEKKWPAVVILHGSNMNAKAYVSTLAATWPDVAKDFVLIGINGETPSEIGGAGKEAAFNYTYINYVGRSTFKGFPGTDRESPALVAQALAELREVYPISKYFVGGHSQGGFLTYSLLMNFPEHIAGAFPISCGIIFQCEPSAYEDDKVRAAQRAVPLAIIHGKQDNIVGFSQGEYAATLFGEARWPAYRFFADTSGAGHRFGLLPVDDAIRWLEAHASDDPAKLIDFADRSFKAKKYRDAIAAVNRVKALDPTKAAKGKLAAELDAKAAAGAKKFLPKPEKKNIDAFLVFRDDFEFAPAVSELMQAFNAMRAEHDTAAKKLLGEANKAFQQGQRDEGYAKYQEIVDQHYAASSYRNVKRWLAERK